MNVRPLASKINSDLDKAALMTSSKMNMTVSTLPMMF